jgi:uncharacterized membrane protein YeaQ/YmgE (transglycosylase-associated protein family)
VARRERRRPLSITGLFSGLVVGIVIGVLGRLVAPDRRPRQIGCLLTVLIGIVGASIGTASAKPPTWGFVTFLIRSCGCLLVRSSAASRR